MPIRILLLLFLLIFILLFLLLFILFILFLLLFMLPLLFLLLILLLLSVIWCKALVGEKWHNYLWLLLLYTCGQHKLDSGNWMS